MGACGFRFTVDEGVHVGRYQAWHPNGQIGTLRHFDAGRESGTQRTWDVNGAVLSNYVVREGRRYGRLDAKPCFTVNEGDTE